VDHQEVVPLSDLAAVEASKVQAQIEEEVGDPDR
jgi:hypothetical protein